MKKISQGQYEIFTTKPDAINKLRQMQGICRDALSDENRMAFTCLKDGKISITDPPGRKAEHANSTNLFAEVIEQDGKTYVTYYTSFNRTNNILKSIFLIVDIIMAIIGCILVAISDNKLYAFAILAVCLAVAAFSLFTNAKEEENSPADSDILINELQRRVEAVNLWDK